MPAAFQEVLRYSFGGVLWNNALTDLGIAAEQTG